MKEYIGTYLLLVIIIAVFQFFVGHKLNGPVDNTKEAGAKALVEASESLVLGDLDKRVHHTRVVFAWVNVGGKFLL